jgi:hypothetical protein
MKLLFENWRKFLLNEEVYGNLIVVYSRTTNESNIANIVENGWKVGNFGEYGPAIYVQYEFEPNDFSDRIYGVHVMKLALKVDKGVLLIDQEAAEKVYGKPTSVEDQIRHFKPELLEDPDVIEWLERERHNWRFAPRIVKDAFPAVLIPRSGPTDKTAIIYQPEGMLTLLSWAKIPKEYSFRQWGSTYSEEGVKQAIEDEFDSIEAAKEEIISYGHFSEEEVEDFTIDEIALELGMSIDTAPYEAGWPIERDKQHTQDLSHVEYSKQGLEWHREINGIKLPQQIRMA